MVLPMIENIGDLSTQDDDSITKIILKDCTAENRVFELQLLPEGYQPYYLTVNSGKIIQGTNGNDIIYVTKNGRSVFTNNGYEEEVNINGYNDITVNCSKDNTYAHVNIYDGCFNVVKTNGARESFVDLSYGSNNNKVVGATTIFVYRSDDNKLYGSSRDDMLSVEGKNNIVYGKAGNDYIGVYGNGGNRFYGDNGKDIFNICIGDGSSGVGTDIICDYRFGTDTIQVDDKNVIADSVISRDDILLNLSNGGTVKVIGAAKNGISILDSSTGKTFNL